MNYEFAKAAIREKSLFDPQRYLNSALSARAPHLFDFPSLLDHYIHVGWKLGLSPSSNFSPKHYLRANPDVEAAEIEPLCHFALQGIVENRSLGRSVHDLMPKTVAFYLPQYHPDPKNENWWGKGFTEWTNVTRAKPFFHEHIQPILPGELGFYDLRVPEVKLEQSHLAKEHGVHGFCYYYYWFNGERVLDRPISEMIGSEQPNFPFCICWANENWTRTWDGMEKEILLEQVHTTKSDYRFIHDVIPILGDHRYIRIDGRPLLLVYRPDLLAEPVRTTELWREVAVQAGLNGLHLGAIDFRVRDPRPFGFDCLVQFPPHHFPAPEFTPQERKRLGVPDVMNVRSYPLGLSRSLSRKPGDRSFPTFPGCMPSWDNTARRLERGTVFHGSTPTLFRLWATEGLLRAARDLPPGGQFMFVNAWNEWAEGAVLEPRRDLGRAYLDALSSANRAVEAYLTASEIDPFIELANWLEAIDNCLLAGRTPAVAIGHDAQVAGAQVLLQQLIEGVQAGTDALDIFTVFNGDGPLLQGSSARVLRAYRFASEGLTKEETADLLMAMLSPRLSSPVLCNTVVTSPFVRAASAWGLKTIFYVHELPTSIAMYLGHDAFRAAAEVATVVVTVSHFARDALIKAFPEIADRVRVVYASAAPATDPRVAERDQDDPLREFGIEPGEMVVFGCGAIHPRKGVDFLPALAEETAKKLGAPVRFIWCGGVQKDADYLTWIKHDLEARGLGSFVLFTGHRRNVARFYDAACAFILPSREDPFPLVVLEAAKARLPVVMFTGAGGAEELLDGLDELIAPYGDVAALADRLSRVLRHEHVRERLGKALRSRVDGPFSWDKYISGLSELWLGTKKGEPKPLLLVSPKLAKPSARISVVIPFYNHGAFIEETLASVAAQTRQADEVIIIDDGSRPDDRERCRAAVAAHANVRFFTRTNKGADVTINEGLELAEGEFVAILNSDDIYHPNRLEQLADAADLRPEIGMLVSECEFIDGAGRRFDQGEWYRGGWRLLDNGMPIWLALLHRNFIMTTSNFFFRKRLFHEVGGFRDFRYAHDLDMLQRVLMQGEIGVIRSELVSYRFHGQNTIRENITRIRAEVAAISAEAFGARVGRDGFDLASAAEITTIVNQQALRGAFDVALNSLEQQKVGAAFYPVCPSQVRASLEEALSVLDRKATEMSQAAGRSLAGAVNIVLESGDNVPQRLLALTQYGELALSAAAE